MSADSGKREVEAGLDNAARDRRLAELAAGPRLGVNTRTRSRWRRIVERVADFASGSGSVHQPFAPNRRVEGAFGRDVDAPSFGKVAVAVDMSSSMTPDMLVSSLQELYTFMRVAGLESDFRYQAFLFRDGVVNAERGADVDGQARRQTFQSLCKSVLRNETGVGATDMNAVFRRIMETMGKRVDAVLVFTDGAVDGGPDGAAASYLKVMKKKVIWVLPKGAPPPSPAFGEWTAEAEKRGQVVGAGGS